MQCRDSVIIDYYKFYQSLAILYSISSMRKNICYSLNSYPSLLVKGVTDMPAWSTQAHFRVEMYYNLLK